MARPNKLRPQDAAIMKTIVDEGCNKSVTNAAVMLDINRPSISSVISGKYALAPYIDKIKKVFPGISDDFLETGKGSPGDLSARQVRATLDAVIKEKDEVIERLSKEIELQRRIIETLMDKKKED